MELIVKPVRPFSFDLSARIFSEGDGRIRKYEDGRYWQVIRPGHKLVLASLKSLGTIDDPELLVDLRPMDVLSNQDIRDAKKVICILFNMDLDLKPFYKAVKGDQVMSRLILSLRGLRSPNTETVFEALVDSIIEQQISLRAAWSLQRRLTETFGEALHLDGKIYYAFPGPQRLAYASVEELRGCGLSYKKSEYIRDMSRLVLNGLDLEKIKGQNQEQIIQELTRIRGVGVWTVELTMVRGMRKLDAMPADDLGLRRCISHYYCQDRKITGDEARLIARRWMGWRGLASFYLIAAERLGISP